MILAGNFLKKFNSYSFDFDLSNFHNIKGPISVWTTNSGGNDKYVKRDGPSINNSKFSDRIPAHTVKTYEIYGIQTWLSANLRIKCLCYIYMNFFQHLFDIFAISRNFSVILSTNFFIFGKKSGIGVTLVSGNFDLKNHGSLTRQHANVTRNYHTKIGTFQKINR